MSCPDFFAEQTAPWEGAPGEGWYRLVLARPFVRCFVRQSWRNHERWRWEVTIGYPGVLAEQLDGEVDTEERAKSAAEAAAAQVIAGVLLRASTALAALLGAGGAR